MSGWIKLEKDRCNDPRVRRMARELCNAGVTHERFTSNFHVTLVLGCLDQFWSYADTYVRDDDTLDIGPDEIDELVGVVGFSQLMPSDWLEILDSDHVKLPGFHEHNGTSAKRKALGQKRTERHRNAAALQHATHPSRKSVTSALPDQDQDQDQDHKDSTARSARPARKFFDEFKTLFPKRNGTQPWKAAERAINARLKDGATWKEILAGAQRYRAWCEATGKIGTETVMQAATFCGPEKHFLERFDIPKTNGMDPARRAELAKAWDKIMTHVKSGKWRKEGSGDERIDHAVDRMGGWNVIALSNTSMNNDLKRRFAEAYHGE